MKRCPGTSYACVPTLKSQKKAMFLLLLIAVEHISPDLQGDFSKELIKRFVCSCQLAVDNYRELLVVWFVAQVSVNGSSKRPFPSCCSSQFRNESWCSTIVREMNLICIRIRNSFPFEWLRTRTWEQSWLSWLVPGFWSERSPVRSSVTSTSVSTFL